MPASHLAHPAASDLGMFREAVPPSQVRCRVQLPPDCAEDCLRLVVLGAAFGRGPNRGFLDKLYVGGRRAGAASPGATSFHPVGVVTRGMGEMLQEQTRFLLEREVWRDATMIHVAPEVVVSVSTRGARWRGGALSAMQLVSYLDDATLAEVDDVVLIEERLGARALQLQG